MLSLKLLIQRQTKASEKENKSKTEITKEKAVRTSKSIYSIVLPLFI